MRGTSSNTSFFSFGPGDSFISKSFEGLRYRNLPSALHKLIAGGSVVDVHWAALGPVSESWVLSFTDVNGKGNLGWGVSTPPSLQQILETLTPTQHLRVFLGPMGSKTIEPSFIAWDPTVIRWIGLPPTLESTIQSWLTPSGWKSGAPKTMTWNDRGSCFAKSEFDEVVYRMGSREGMDDDDWPPFQDTVREWDGETGFKWSDVAYLNLDSRNSDQFIAIRTDGTWAGSIDADANEEALEAFALNFFARLKSTRSASSKPKAKPTPQPKSQQRPQQQNTRNNSYRNGSGGANGGTSPPPVGINTIPSAVSQQDYNRWATDTAIMLSQAVIANNAPTSNSETPTQPSKARSRPPKKIQIRSGFSPNRSPSPGGTGQLLTTFPYLPTTSTTCPLPSCLHFKSDPAGLRACKHDIERMLRASGLYNYEWLRQERIRWHPDRFGRLCDESFRERGRRVAEEMFKIVDGLVGEAEEERDG
ncbi:hypothetical protein K504DRAFT_462878 [Pleomassaria siparia CBS 279.74]|uniref:Uncharacterized protein n=1 Tax=Pleomassaria siparia CBS 279.74 TaxID=1314801 RepID=A0A6G1JUM5_9PLEO|nr:hypothetical protein K504DRAFT_462878 [Pleomassaria siparia CBS 279.74]